MADSPMTGRDSADESIHTERRGITQVVRNFFGGGTRAQDVILAVAIVVIVIESAALHDAYKDLQTQVWLRDDALTKFTSGPYADLRAETKANQILIERLGLQGCTKPK